MPHRPKDEAHPPLNKCPNGVFDGSYPPVISDMGQITGHPYGVS